MTVSPFRQPSKGNPDGTPTHAGRPNKLQLAARWTATIEKHAQREFPCECCGLLLGQVADRCVAVSDVIQATNITQDDRRKTYQVDWRTLVQTLRSTRNSSQPIVGFYHSHPDSPPRPSRRDAEFAWSDHVYLIISLSREKRVRWGAWYWPFSQDGFQSMSLIDSLNESLNEGH